MVHHPKSGLSNPDRKFAEFNAVELVYIHQREYFHVEFSLSPQSGFFSVDFTCAKFTYYFYFKQTDLPVSNYQEVSTTAGRIKEGKTAKLFLKFLKPLSAIAFQCLDLFELRAETIKKQRFNNFEDVFLGSIVRALRSTFCRFHDRLEKRAENRWRYVLTSQNNRPREAVRALSC